ncbi:transposase [Candidatus Tisiphia endosymbiont of Sialis lutaria]|uniref:transposase n=1 Tax=Candidatus Tisiphia endosymbiont of Sialis lutaria TaxID=2029164 RepID=UPI00312CBC5B
MTKEKARVFSAEEKTRIVLEVLKEESPLSVIASKYEINSKTISNWKKQFISNAALAFEPAKLVSKYQEQINMLKEQNDELAKTLGKTIVERDWAVGKLPKLGLIK